MRVNVRIILNKQIPTLQRKTKLVRQDYRSLLVTVTSFVFELSQLFSFLTKMYHLSDFVKAKIIVHWEDNHSIMSISRELGVAVSRIINIKIFNTYNVLRET